MSNRTKTYIVGSILAWVIIISFSAAWNIVRARQSQVETHLESARSFFELIVTVREWDADQGGVYVPISDEIRPNPYLDVPERDITTTTGLKLTLINPAYLTRLIADLAAERNNVKFHITSLKPIRPANAPETWESIALMSFEKGQTEYFEHYTRDKVAYFRYMAPLITEQSCLKCHEKQGYQVGNIRGGISITFPETYTTPWVLVASHVLIACLGSALLLRYGSKLGQTLQVLENLSNLDSLTQIPNRRSFNEYMQREFLRSQRNKVPLSIVMGDIDNFKAFNDTYGHLVGDHCLAQVSQAFSGVLKRPGDFVARYGGEEFAFILPYTNAEGALSIGDLLRAKVESLQIPHAASPVSQFVTISMGIATYLGDGNTSMDEVLRSADQALYQAKSGGKNRVEQVRTA